MPVSGPELLLVAAVLLLLFGATRLPKVARSIGQARSEYRRGAEDQPQSAP